VLTEETAAPLQGSLKQGLALAGEPCAVNAECTSGACVLTLPDVDGDGFAPAGAAPLGFCDQAPPGRTTRPPISQQTTDCCDSAAGGGDFRPNQTVGSVVPVPACAHAGDPEGFDRDCSGVASAPNALQNRVQACADTTIASCTSRGGFVPRSFCGDLTGGDPDETIPGCGDIGCFGPCATDQTGSCFGAPGGPLQRACL
jgi:hypothetical protein